MAFVEQLPTIIEGIKAKNLSIISAPTGTGKSSELPRALAKLGQRTFVTLPTVAGVINLYHYQLELNRRRKEEISVGYAAAGSVHYKAENKLIYATAGHVKHILLDVIKQNIDDPNRRVWLGMFCQVLIIDEAHTGLLDNSIIVALWNYILGNGPNHFKEKQSGKVPKLILSSASRISENALALEPYLIYKNKAEPSVFRYDFKLPGYAVEIFYQNPQRQLYEQMAAILRELHDDTYAETSGAFLVFLPGKGEVNQVYNAITIPAEEVTLRVITSEVDPKELGEILNYHAGDKRLIILATNAVESSVTIPDLFLVLDSMQEKVLEDDNGTPTLNKELISLDSAQQRAGRVGRTREGVVYRMLSEAQYHKLRPSREPEIYRVSLNSFVLELVDAHINPENFIKSMNQGDISNRIGNAVETLFKLNLIFQQDKGLGITDAGHFTSRFPIDIRLGTLLYSWLATLTGINDLYFSVVIISLIAMWTNNVIQLPYRNQENEANYESLKQDTLSNLRNKLKPFLVGAEDFRDDLDVIMAVWLSYWDWAYRYPIRVEGERSQPDWNSDRTWAKAFGLKYNQIKQIFRTMDRVSAILKKDKQIETLRFAKLNPQHIREKFITEIRNIYKGQILSKSVGKRGDQYVNQSGVSFYLDRNGLVQEHPEKLIALKFIKSQGNVGTISFFIQI